LSLVRGRGGTEEKGGKLKMTFRGGKEKNESRGREGGVSAPPPMTRRETKYGAGTNSEAPLPGADMKKGKASRKDEALGFAGSRTKRKMALPGKDHTNVSPSHA